jgi:hypothetical protein
MISFYFYRNLSFSRDKLEAMVDKMVIGPNGLQLQD